MGDRGWVGSVWIPLAVYQFLKNDRLSCTVRYTVTCNPYSIHMFDLQYICRTTVYDQSLTGSVRNIFLPVNSSSFLLR